MAESRLLLAALALLIAFNYDFVDANKFYDECDIPWGPENTWAEGDDFALSLTNSTGSMLRTKRQFLFGSVQIEIKLVPGNSAGTVTTYYTTSLGDNHDEIDFEFLGNETGQPYTIHTNVFANGVGDKEQQFKPWFDPSADFHNYTIFWNPSTIVWFVDQIPIRVFRNYESIGIPFPTFRPMKAYSSIWNADEWATQKGRVKTDWTQAPFIARYRNIQLNICDCYNQGDINQCSSSQNWYTAPEYSKLNDEQLGQMQWVRNNYIIYDYCTDYERFNGQMAPECSQPQY
ncbi:probable xyloglucan endotransglucosylase/hydrolase protein 26 [Typha latifolia]|uniref:probable xyloglucan endotransglucosylase/hydrolase protein 26 n=1 Tax=Typha latifolia TaxID=4733 RepID=UPI003C2E148F